MKTLEVAKATASLAEYARDASKEPIILTVSGHGQGKSQRGESPARGCVVAWD